MYQLIFVVIFPSICFWTAALSLHLLGANKGYSNKSVPVSAMITTQLFVDVLQALGTLPRFFIEPHSNHLLLRPHYVLVGAMTLDVIEYFGHRAMHTFKFLNQFHKKHHKLIPVHTFGTFYNSVEEALFLGSLLGLTLVGILKLSALEISMITGFSMVMAVLDHTPSSFWGKDTPPSHHEIHHNINPNTNFSQPFTPFMDWLCGTLYVPPSSRNKKD